MLKQKYDKAFKKALAFKVEGRKTRLHKENVERVGGGLQYSQILFSNGKFEMKMTHSSNKNSILKQLEQKKKNNTDM